MLGIEEHDKINAVFRPKRTDDLQPGCEEFVGRSGEFQAVWVIEDGPYEGQFAMWVPKDWNFEGFPAVWVPECDLEPQQD